MLNCSHSFIQSAFAEYALGTCHKSGNRAMRTTGTDSALGGNSSPVMEAQHSLRRTTCVRVMKGRWVGSRTTGLYKVKPSWDRQVLSKLRSEGWRRRWYLRQVKGEKTVQKLEECWQLSMARVERTEMINGRWGSRGSKFNYIKEFEKLLDFPGGSVVENSPANTGDGGSIPGSGRSPGGGSGTHSSNLAWEIPWTEGAWRAAVHRVAKSLTWLKWRSVQVSSREEVCEPYYPIWPHNIQY